MSREGRRRWALNERFLIGPDDNPMLERWRLIQTPWFGVYVHFIYREDLDRDPHDHPWSFWTFVLRGGYIEQYHPDTRHMDRGVAEAIGKHYPGWVHNPRRFHYFPLGAAHRITWVMPKTTTLCLVGRKQRIWGFWTPDGWVDYREYEGTLPARTVMA